MKRLLDEEEDGYEDVKPSVSQIKFHTAYVKREIKDEPIDEFEESSSLAGTSQSLPVDLKSVKKEPSEAKPVAIGSNSASRQKDILKGLVVVKKQKKSDDKVDTNVAQVYEKPNESKTSALNPLANILGVYGNGDSSDGSVSD